MKVQSFLHLSILVSRYTFPAAGAKLAPDLLGLIPNSSLLAFFSPLFFWWVGLLLDGVTVEAQAFKAMASQGKA